MEKIKMVKALRSLKEKYKEEVSEWINNNPMVSYSEGLSIYDKRLSWLNGKIKEIDILINYLIRGCEEKDNLNSLLSDLLYEAPESAEEEINELLQIYL